MNNLELAYEVFKNDMLVINIITDNSFVSVTEFSTLLSTIIAKRIKPKFINKILMSKGVISRRNLDSLQEQQTSNLNVNKYVVNSAFSIYCEERNYENGLFYIWNPNFLFKIFGIDLRSSIDNDNISTLITIIKNFFGKNVVYAKVHNNLLYLQLILKRECIFYN